jgi:hypothetical protein
MREGDVAAYWPAYADRFLRVSLAAAPAGGLLRAQSTELPDYLTPDATLRDVKPWSFFPPLLGAGVAAAVPCEAIMTGGRTFLLTEEGADSVGFPRRLYLDLERLGWGQGALEVRPEVKGAGTLFERTRISRARLEALLPENPVLQSAYERLSSSGVPPVLLCSLGMYLKRILGGQDGIYGAHDVRVSNALLRGSTIKYVPVWTVASYPEDVVRNLEFVSRALMDDTPLCDRTFVNEVRFTPGTIRAIYFDTAETDDQLMLLCRRISESRAELSTTWSEMVEDAGRYLETIAASTEETPEGYAWVKAGDINEVFKPNAHGLYDEAYDYRHRKKIAWFLAKDEVVVRRLGKVFADMEGYWGGTTRFKSADRATLRFHHDLYGLMVLRDHVRVCTAFRVGLDLLDRGRCDARRRAALQAETCARIVDAVQRRPNLKLVLGDTCATLHIYYPRLGFSEEHVYPRWQLREKYNPQG